ncbi:LytR family transcriptional regulator [bacterium]|nr:LytR family transcriptional regulator [bacterium]
MSEANQNFFKKLSSIYKTLKRKKWFFLIKIPAYFLIAYAIWAFVLATALSRAIVLEFLITLMPKTKLNGVNVLVVGIDNTADVQRSDTIMVLHLDASKNRIGVLSIPRDTRVNIPGVGLTKINHAYAYGGISLLRHTVVEFLSVPVDYTIKVNLDGIQSLVDQVGGVVVDVPKNMYYMDQAGDLYIDLKKGRQSLNGHQAMEYLRFRHDNNSDIGRIKRQQDFIRSLADRVVELGDKAELPQIISKLSASVETDMSNRQMAGLAVQFRDALEANQIDVGTIPGTVALVAGVSYWKPDITLMDQTIGTILLGINRTAEQPAQKIITADKSASEEARRTVTLKEVNRVAAQTELAATKPTQNAKTKAKALKPGMVVEVLNGTGIPGEANRAASQLKKLGLRVKRTGNAGSFKYANTIIVDWRSQIDYSVALAQVLSVDPSKIIVYDRPEKSIDATIVIGKDWTQKHSRISKTPPAKKTETH